MPRLAYQSAAAFVRDIAVSTAFYTQVLGLAVQSDFGKNVILEGGISLWEIDPAHILVERLGIEALADSRANRFEFCFETDDVDAALRALNANDVDFVHSVHEEPWGQRTVRFFDPDRHLIEIGESMATFVTRLAGKMTIQEVSGKTGIPAEELERLVG